MYERWERMQDLESDMEGINMKEDGEASEGRVAHVQIRILGAQ